MNIAIDFISCKLVLYRVEERKLFSCSFVLILVSIPIFLGILGLWLWRCSCLLALSINYLIFQVDYACTPEEVQQHFQASGTVNRVTILTDEFGLPKGVAYVEFEEQDAAQQALKLNESELHARQLKVYNIEAIWCNSILVLMPCWLRYISILSLFVTFSLLLDQLFAGATQENKCARQETI